MNLRLMRRFAVFALPFCMLPDAQALELSERLQPAAASAAPAFPSAAAPAVLAMSESLDSQQPEDRRARVLDAAIGMLGTAYRLGRDSIDAVDCSALMQRVFGSVGEELPRTTRELLVSGEAVGRGDLRVGDLLFYRWQRRQLHVALYVDDNTIIHASPSAGRVVMTELSPDWQRHLVAVRRVL